MATNKYYISAGLQPSKDTDNEYTGPNQYSMVAGLPKVAESEGGGGGSSIAAIVHHRRQMGAA
jgi:hypothetical protein